MKMTKDAGDAVVERAIRVDVVVRFGRGLTFRDPDKLV